VEVAVVQDHRPEVALLLPAHLQVIV